ncbi:RIP metalloprotease RseP [Candidatus Uhrbacteria bacterium CG10_big_fil_rev_8_21_14_0_10_50_16]|uniref:Zinc metalloprotease n=1 Tax=Candidatus Uhrbacteria bacterium CG10_big_fil_rev_8_21_14_0_10_50_16 TaxID=1975039 RepID=A0A2H0RLD2_9BACT|nr:MAG: RIP metalloprotease RseP [Candidatus Uhrbacteria bacterium CG10_big_fil_rev_8_21_14_0_10_50_16]
MITALIFIAVLAVLVLAHEFGHFAVAKWSGMRVDEFGFGFPPKLFGIKRGETEYTINLIPLGGFVKIHGESGEERDDPRSFASKSIWKRFLVLVAGVTMNVLLAWVLLSAGFMAGLPTAIDGGDFAGGNVKDEQVQITYVLPGSPAEEVGLVLGDRVLSVNGQSVIDAAQTRELIGLAQAGEELELVIARTGEDQSRTIMVAPVQIEEGLIAIGTQLTTVGYVSFPPHLALLNGATSTANMVAMTAVGFWDLLGRLVTGKGLGGDVSGPVGIAVLTGQVADLGFVYLLNFAAVLSVNLAILNILPFPALDGGRVFFLLIELIRRKPVTPKFEATVHAAGFAMLMILVVLVTYKDLLRFF